MKHLMPNINKFPADFSSDFIISYDKSYAYVDYLLVYNYVNYVM